MKKIMVTMFFFSMFGCSFAQTSAQIQLVDKFFNNSGGNILQDVSHPVCTWSYATVKAYSNHTYYISLHYTQVLTSKVFTCQYKLEMSRTGKFLSLKHIECNSPNSTCFWVYSAEDAINMTTYEDRVRFEKYMGKNMWNMDAKEYSNVKLFYTWYDRGYFSLY